MRVRRSWFFLAVPLVIALSAPLRATEIGGVPQQGAAGGSRDAVGVAVGIPQLVALHWDHSVASSLDLSLHAGGLIWLGSVGGRLRWRSSREGTHPYAFAGGALLAVLIPIDDDDTTHGGFWVGGGVEWVRPRWKLGLEVSAFPDAGNMMTPCGALIWAWRL